MQNSYESSTTNPKQGRGNTLGVLLAGIMAVAMFFSGIKVGEAINPHGQNASLFNIFTAESAAIVNDPQEHPNLDSFWRVWDLLEEKFATGSTTQATDITTRLEGAIDGLVDSYNDPYTIYLPPSDAEAFSQDISGNFSGVGMEIGVRDRLLTIISPLPDTPAERAGLLAGDVIVRINGSTTEDMRVDEAVRNIRGEKGTVVDLQIFREGESEFLDIPVTRDTILIPTVKTEVHDDAFVIKLYSFNAVAESQVQQALAEYLASDTENLIVDLRGNPGGFLQGAVGIASYFLPAGKVVVEEHFGDPTLDKTFRSSNRKVANFTPKNLVVLVDNGSASASEILAGALKDHETATIIGTQTFGKGSVQELIELEDGSALKVTVARWLTPKGVSISEGGLAPDILINRTPQQRIAEEDPQLDAALRFLAGEAVTSETFEEKLESAPDSE